MALIRATLYVGAGKTNVAMLTLVSHLRDVGLIGSAYYDNDHHYDGGPVATGKKIVYIAPSKSLITRCCVFVNYLVLPIYKQPI